MSGLVRLSGDSLEAQPGAEVTVRACPDGPWLVRWADGVVTEDGQVHPTTRPVVAVCSCDKTQRAPWCDGTHKVIPRST